MTRLIEKIGNHKEIILFRVGKADLARDLVILWWVAMERKHTYNNNGERSTELCYTNSLKIMNGWNIELFIVAPSHSDLKSIIDYVILKQNTHPYIHDIRIKTGAECG